LTGAPAILVRMEQSAPRLAPLSIALAPVDGQERCVMSGRYPVR